MEQGALQEVLSFSGKRNCVFTFVVGGDISLAELKKHLAGVDRKISAIKHKNKAGQGHRVLSVVNERLEARKTKPANVIICCGLREGDHIDYFELDIPKTAVCDEFEYYYDYVFHTERIKDLLFSDVVVRADEAKFLEQLQKLCGQSSPLLFLGKEEVLKGIDAEDRRLGTMVIFGAGDDLLSVEVLEKCRNQGIRIHKLALDLAFCDKWGKIFGIARY